MLLFFFANNLSAQQSTAENCFGQTVDIKHPMNSYAKVKRFLQQFSSFNGNSSLAQSRAYYLNSKAIIFIDSFLRSSNNAYSGVKAYFIVPSYQTNWEQFHTSQQFIRFVPARGADRGSDFDAFRNFFNALQNNSYFTIADLNHGQICPGHCDDSLMQRWSGAKLSYNPVNIMPDRRNEDSVLFFDKSLNDNDSARYYNSPLHGQKLNRYQTRFVYFSRATFEYLADFINNNSGYPLIGAYFSNYGSIEAQGQKDSNQTTIGFIPLKLMPRADGTSSYQPDVCTYFNYFTRTFIKKNNIKTQKQYDKAIKEKTVENHGALCPQLCN